jgi:hypothetical protein
MKQIPIYAQTIATIFEGPTNKTYNIHQIQEAALCSCIFQSNLLRTLAADEGMNIRSEFLSVLICQEL